MNSVLFELIGKKLHAVELVNGNPDSTVYIKQPTIAEYARVLEDTTYSIFVCTVDKNAKRVFETIDDVLEIDFEYAVKLNKKINELLTSSLNASFEEIEKKNKK